MKRTLQCWCVALALLLGGGCKSPEQAAYRATGAIVLAVDAAMNGWGDYVRAGLAKPEQEAAVRKAYDRYQSALRAVSATASRPERDKDAFVEAMRVLDASRLELIELVQALRK